MVDPKKAIILWNSDSQLRVSELKVYDIDAQPASSKNLSSSAGASDHGWMGGSQLETPIGQFLWLSVAYGFSSDAVLIDALKEFNTIKGQGWALEILQQRFGHP
ncbi:hypothetical protein [Azospirillum sp. B2RO_4]|uniref:hypothetical protein n=1 Tax=Azospirillum sp. B2RO_4 TaxID=3027796 RepID=UPI003DA8140B